MSKTIIDLILSNVCEVLITIIFLVVSCCVIPWLKEKRIYDIIVKFVQAAEKMAESGQIEKTDKKEVVVALLENKGIIVNETINALIESCVKELDIATSVVYEEIIEVEED